MNPQMKMAKVLKAFRGIDEGKLLLNLISNIDQKGNIRDKVFFNILEFMDIKLSQNSIT